MILLATLFALTSQQVTDDAARTRCQALARVIMADLRGQRSMIDAYRAAHPTPTAAEQAILDGKVAAHDEDAKLFEALRVRYASAPKPTPEALAKLQNETSYAEIKRQARACL